MMRGMGGLRLRAYRLSRCIRLPGGAASKGTKDDEEHEEYSC
jgi:hypothetical protein